MKKKLISLLISGVLAAVMLTGCGSSGSGTSSTPTPTKEAEAKTEINEDEEVTLHIFGPGLLASQGENGALNMVTGLETPGYDVIEKRWNELHPNVKLEIEGAPWDSWQSAVQTAALGGELDIILHGATLTALVEPLDDYIAKDPEYAQRIYTTETRRTTDVNDLSVSTVTGIPYTLNPQICYIDKQIFENYGVALPDASWTWEDLLALAEKMTGTDPVTGKQTYGVQVDSMDNANNSFFTFQMVASAYDAQIFTYGKTVEESSVDYHIPEAIRAFQMIRDLGQYCSPNVKEGVNVSYQLTKDNDTAIRYSQDSFTHFREAEVAGIEDRFVFMSMPTIEAGTYKGTPSSFKGCNNIAICKDSKNKDWAWEFVKFLTTDSACVQWVVDCGQLPNTPEGMTIVKDIMGEKAENVKIALESMPNDFSNSSTAYYNNISFGPVTANMGSVTNDLVNGTISAEQAADQMQKVVDEYLAAQ